MDWVTETKIFNKKEFIHKISLWNKIKLWFKKPIYSVDFGGSETVYLMAKELSGVVYVLKIWTKEV